MSRADAERFTPTPGLSFDEQVAEVLRWIDGLFEHRLRAEQTEAIVGAGRAFDPDVWDEAERRARADHATMRRDVPARLACLNRS